MSAWERMVMLFEENWNAGMTLFPVYVEQFVFCGVGAIFRPVMGISAKLAGGRLGFFLFSRKPLGEVCDHLADG